MKMIETLFVEELKKLGLELSEKQLNQFRQYYQLLVEWNSKINLTAITDEEGVYIKHFFDSLTPAIAYDFSKSISLADIGAGAGFPSIPLKICFPHIQISIVDSLNKRIQFLRKLCEELELDNVQLFHSRAEDFAQLSDKRESFDLVTARAVARLNVLSELCLPLVKINQFFISLKASEFEEEVLEAKKAIKALGGKIEKIKECTLPNAAGNRSLIMIKKETISPKKYPRKAGVPNKNPLK
jgi:16S rRNA (guanine527-N7)-methyltransferase